MRFDRPQDTERPASARLPPTLASPHPARSAAPNDADAARPRVLHEIFEAQVDAQPDAPAVVCGRDGVTYAGLDRRANRIAYRLQACGVSRGALVGILLPRSVDAYAALLGILKAGAAYVPLDPDDPPDRVGFILKDSDAAALVTTGALGARHPFRGVVVRPCSDLAGDGPWCLLRPARAPKSRDLCSVIYTRGSTGHPKGVMIEHRSACHLVSAEGALFGVRPGDRVLQAASLAFDLSVEEIWLAFRAGATLVAATQNVVRAGPDLARRLTELRVTVLSCVPSLLEAVAEDVPTLRLLILGGEACPAPLVARWSRPGRRIVNTYGATETTVIATHADVVAGRPVTVGRPLQGCRVRLLDAALRPVAPGAVGEICIGGAGVARGYLNLPERTRERFVRDPFAPGERLYRSGDLGRLDPEGNLVFLGRSDSLVMAGRRTEGRA